MEADGDLSSEKSRESGRENHSRWLKSAGSEVEDRSVQQGFE